MSDESAAPERAEVDAVPFVVSIETRGINIRLEGVGASEARALALWKAVAEHQDSVPTRIEGGSVAGFQFEQGDEALHDRLPGGWAR
jgi:hypothetical protein